MLIPHGTGKTSAHDSLSFDSVYTNLLEPAIRSAGYIALRVAPQELRNSDRGLVRERVRMCQFLIADVSLVDCDVSYEVGRRDTRHTPVSQLVAARSPSGHEGSALEYLVRADGTADDDQFAEILADRLTIERSASDRWSVHDFLGDWPGLPHTKTDLFRESISYDPVVMEAIRRARAGDDPVSELADVERSFESLQTVQAAALVDLLLSYRGISAWHRMVEFVERLPSLLATQSLVREQYGLALNRVGRHAEALVVLEELTAEHGQEAELCSLLGRIHKDLSLVAVKAGDVERAEGHRNDAIDAYLQGFEADWRDAYPGINAVQLIARRDRQDPRLPTLIAVVEYSLRRKIDRDGPDYWDHATLLELATLAEDEVAAGPALDDALSSVHEGWMTESTAETLEAIVATGAPDWVGEAAARLRRAR